MKNIKIELKDHSYDIFVGNGILDEANTYIKKVYNNKNLYIITDDIVSKLYLDKLVNVLKNDFNVKYVIVPHGEESKTIKYYTYVAEELIKMNIRRNELLVALGGGVIGDLTGFVAGTLYRGIPYVGIPTSLLSQMDSSIGGKTGIDFANRKNILGCFKQPSLVLIDPKALNSLPKREFNNVMCELINHGAIGNLGLLNLLESKPIIDEKIIKESLIVKKSVVEIDEFDQKERMTLNFGHTFGHAIELKYHYKHGEAVAIGMLMAIKLGIDLKITPNECYDKIYNILKLYNLPAKEYDYKEYLEDILYDKKNIAGTINFILLDKLGSSIIYKLTEQEIKEKLL